MILERASQSNFIYPRLNQLSLHGSRQIIIYLVLLVKHYNKTLF